MTPVEAEFRVCAKWLARLQDRVARLSPEDQARLQNHTRGIAGYLRQCEAALNAPAREDRRVEAARRIAQEALG